MKVINIKAARLLQIEVLLLDHPEGLTQSEIARRMGVNRSTILRNLADIQAPICEDHGRYFIDRKAYLVNVRFNLPEALSIHLASRMLAAGMDRQNTYAASALRKLGLAIERLAPHLSNHLAQSADSIDEEAQWQDPNFIAILETLTQAWAENRKVKIWHRSDPNEPVKQYDFSVYFIEPSAIGRSTYAIGLSDPPGQLRTLKIERIQRCEILREPYAIPADFDPKKLLSHAWGIWYTEGDPVEVILKFSPRVAGRVKETRWHRSEQTVALEDGSLLWRAWIAEPQEMMPWVRGWGAEVEVLEPENMRAAVAEEARKMVEIYGGRNK